MANIKVKTNFSLKKDIKKLSKKALRNIKRQSVDIILDEYNKGISPVKGTNLFSKYEESTKKRKGRYLPVTIKETGRLHKSLRAIIKGSSIMFGFAGRRNEKIAKFLHFGTIHMNARPLLPTKGMEFKKKIINSFSDIIKRSFAALK